MGIITRLIKTNVLKGFQSFSCQKKSREGVFLQFSSLRLPLCMSSICARVVHVRYHSSFKFFYVFFFVSLVFPYRKIKQRSFFFSPF